MSFHHPMLLWLLALPILWAFWQWVRRGHPVVVPFDYGHQREGKRLRGLLWWLEGRRPQNLELDLVANEKGGPR